VTRADPTRGGLPHPRLWWTVGLITGLAFVGLTVAVGTRADAVLDVDRSVGGRVHEAVLSSPVLESAGWVLTALGYSVVGWPVAALVAAVLAARGRPWWSVWLVVDAVVVPQLVTLVKHLVHRPRPVWPDPVATAGGWSYPSGHAANGIAVWVAIAVLVAGSVARQRVAGGGGLRGAAARVAPWLLAAVGVGIGLSRIVLGVHNPSDVVGGWLLAASLVCITAGVVRWWELGAAAGSPARRLRRQVHRPRS
jgi:membrane-associated phospholipid phosphatase